jgi:hypothetical protein
VPLIYSKGIILCKEAKDFVFPMGYHGKNEKKGWGVSK